MKHSRGFKIILLLGPPGSGKGTQARLLCKKLGLKYVGSGDVLRARQKQKDFTGLKLTSLMNSGALAPSFVIVKILGDELEKLKKQKKIKGFVLDGWTRMVYEAVLADEAIGWYEWGKSYKVIFIKVSARVAINRLTKRRQCKSCGRLIPWVGEFKKLTQCDACKGELVVRIDDNLKSIKKRLEEYRAETLPAINYYRKKKKLIEVNGEQGIEDVFKEVLKKLK